MLKNFEPNKIFSITSKAPKYVLFVFIIVIIKKNKTYFGALDVIENILFGSKFFNIRNIYIKKFILFDFFLDYSDQEYRRGR